VAPRDVGDLAAAEGCKMSRPSLALPRIPFVTCHPLTDVKLVILLLPLWWLLGIEQFVGPVLLSLAVIKSWIIRPYLRVTPTLAFLLLVLVTQLASMLAIDEPFRLLTFARTWGTYVAATGLLIVVSATTLTWTQVRGLLHSVVIAMTIAGAVGLAGILGWWRPEVTSVAASWLPSWIVETGYGGAIAHRQIGAVAWFAPLGNYFRVDSFFLFSTMYAAALAVTIPTAIYLVRTARGWTRLFYVAASALLGVNLLFTTGRVAMVALVAGAAYWLVHDRSRLVQALVLSLAVSASAAVGLVGDWQGTVGDVVYARGTGSVESRSIIYRLTLEGVVERPIFGWGTERDVADLAYPAGSHSHHLGVLFKFGVVGFVAYLALGVALWFATAPRVRRPPDGRQAGREMHAFLRYARWTLVTAALIGFTSVLDLDATVTLLLWAVLAAAIATRRLLAVPTTDQGMDMNGAPG
jgi:polysaccharide biosynthesis protein PslJ